VTVLRTSSIYSTISKLKRRQSRNFGAVPDGNYRKSRLHHGQTDPVVEDVDLSILRGASGDVRLTETGEQFLTASDEAGDRESRSR
jgi:hypothetical protein